MDEPPRRSRSQSFVVWVGERLESRDRIVSRGVTEAELTAYVLSNLKMVRPPN